MRVIEIPGIKSTFLLPQVTLTGTSSRHRQGRRSRPTMPSHAPPRKRLNALGLVENGPGVQKKSYLRVVSARAPVGSVRPSVRRSQCIAPCGRCCTGGHSKLGDACRYQAVSPVIGAASWRPMSVLIDRGKDVLCSESKCLPYTLAVGGEQNIGALFMCAHAASCCSELARQLRLPVCISGVRSAGCGGRMWV